MKKYILFLFLIANTFIGNAQIGANSIFKFLNLPTNATSEALGGKLISIQNENISLAIQNPTLIDSNINKQLIISNSFFLDGMNNGSIAYGIFHKKIKTPILYTLQYSTGNFDERDEAGNDLGNFRVGQYNLQAGTSKMWKNFGYGINAKFILSHLANYTSIGLATDIGLGYHNKKKNLSATFLIANAGIQLKSYVKDNREKLPLNVSISFSKKFKHLPLTLSITTHNLQKWNLIYPIENSTIFVIGNTNTTTKKGKEIVDNIFRHFAFGGEIQAGKPVKLRFGYNHLRRQELGVGRKKGFTGISVGFGLNIKQFAFDYAFAPYSKAASNHFLTLRIKLDEFGNKAK